jgi:selenocysteine-specific elongation factor
VKVIGTAGHIDHGKSTLVRRLTGIDPDRLSEEKRRGMTIDLGFAWLELPSGPVSVIDVPGHEGFVKNMLAGATGVDVALLVVAADEGVMPQTREHLDILDLLGIEQGVVAISKTDLVDQDWLELVTEEVRTVISATRMAGSELVPVSGLSGTGVDKLVLALDGAVRRAETRADLGCPFLPVDRVFSLAGFGTVVTGTLHGGTLVSGREIEVLPVARRARIRSIQTHGQAVDAGNPGDRVALNLVGVDRHDVRRGDIVSPPARIRATRKFDARARVLDGGSQAIRHGAEVMLHIGTAEMPAKLSILDAESIDAGQEKWVQVRTSGEVVAVPGQRFILRLPSPARTIGGGEVVDVSPRHRRHDPAALERLYLMSSGATEDLVLGALLGPRPRRLGDIQLMLGRSESLIREGLEALAARREVVRLGDWFLSWETWTAVSERVHAQVQTFHNSFPLRPGVPREELRSRIGWPPAAWQALLPALEAAGVIRADSKTVALPTFQASLGEQEVAMAVLDRLRSQPHSPPTRTEIQNSTGATQDLFAALEREGRIVRLDADVYLDRGVFDEMVAATLSRIRASGTITVAELRDLFGSSRRYALAFLELMDARGITFREGDRRVLGKRGAACG